MNKQMTGGHVKAIHDDEGTFEAYVSVFGVVDSHGDIVERGAFAKSLNEWAEKGRTIPVYFGHRTDDPNMCVGRVIEAVEDDHGLKASIQIDMDGPRGAQTFRLVKDGRLSEMSFGYTVRDHERKNGTTVLRELELLEVSIVPVGANRQTSISNVKSDGLSVTDSKETNMTDTAIKTISSKSERDELHVKAQEMAAKADELDDAGKAELLGMVELVKKFDADASAALESQALVAAVAALGGEPAAPAEAAKSAGPKYMTFTGRKAHSVAMKTATAMLGGSNGGVKSLVSSGSSVVGVALEDKTPIEQNRIPTSFLDLIPVKQHSTPIFRYLQQSGRDLNAAVWESGQKPESSVSVEHVDNELKVIATVSEGLDTYTLLDNDELASFVEAEFRYGLQQAVEREVLNGDGTGAHMTGLLHTSGVMEQEYAADPITTARKAITALESAGFVPDVFVIRPEDAETVDLQRNASGALDQGNATTDRAAQRLHGVRYVVSTALPAGKALLLAGGALRVDVDTRGIQTQWGTVGNDFGENLIRVRSELRASVSVLRAGGVVVIDTQE